MLTKLLVLTVVALIAPYIIPGVKVRGPGSAVGIALLFALLNLLIGWLLKFVLALISLPVVLLTFGLFMFVITLAVNAILLRLTDMFMDSFELKGWGPAFGMALLFALGTWGLEQFAA